MVEKEYAKTIDKLINILGTQLDTTNKDMKSALHMANKIEQMSINIDEIKAHLKTPYHIIILACLPYIFIIALFIAYIFDFIHYEKALSIIQMIATIIP